MITIIVLIVIYIISILMAKKYITLSHYHPKGKWVYSQPSTDDIFIILIPAVNTFVGLGIVTGDWKNDKYKTVDFFKPKK